MRNFGGEGYLIAGRYELVSRLGRGGMGTVWRAVDQLLVRDVAVKELHVGDEGLSALDAQLLGERTLREARTVAQIKHPNVIVLHDVVEEDERAWIVMELVDGVSLADRLAAQGPVGPREAGGIVLALLDALRAAHARGVLHRDLKPANVLMESGTGRVVLTDFGIAQVSGATTITETGSFVGSPEYTAPERMSGRRTGPESDLWSLGVLLCTLVSGQSPFHRDSLAGVLHAVVFDEIAVPEAAGGLKPVVEGLLRREPEQRLSTEETARLLRAYVGSADTPEMPLPRTEPRPGRALVPETAPGPVPGPDSGAVPVGAATGAASGTAGKPGKPEESGESGKAGTSGRGGRFPGGRKAVVAVAAVLALAGAGAGAVALLNNGGDDKRASGTSSHTSDNGHNTDNGRNDGGKNSRPSRTPEPSAPPSDAIPEGYERVKDPLGFSLAVPEGYSRSVERDRIYYYSPGKEFRIGVQIQQQDPKGPLGLSRQADAKGPSDYPGYRSGQVIETTHRGRPAALWAFIWNGSADDGGSRQTFDLSWDENSDMVDLWLSAPVAQKGVGKRHFDTAVRTFTRSGTAN
ncbi:serine/threonine-protein kinase [Streptomyces coffeae]|uniref:non-specific serine/threonine protein kinase n=1 Tax=Streptomyces coffeae TaxID=621382 RepID=A0ABS1N660_9ACTN|nr:serine/threonine-protein kinase [Streptomyces coffeae]MBL1095414.1 serine/threonine protein kinase [Streptomyces coffeae]